MECEICEIINHPSDDELSRRIYDGKYWRVTLRPDQEYLGTCFVTVKRHVPSLADLSEQEDREFIAIRNQLIATQEGELGARLVNVSCLMNDAMRGSGHTHVHYHFKPRYAQPVEFAGESFKDRQFGYYIRDKYPHEVSKAVAQKILAVLKQPFTR